MLLVVGTSANAVNFQAYLADGITRWNAARAADSIDQQTSSSQSLRTFDVRLQHRINSLSDNLNKDKVFPLYRRPNKYTGKFNVVSLKNWKSWERILAQLVMLI